MSDIFIEAVMFGENTISINYFEHRDIGDSEQLFKRFEILCVSEQRRQLYADLQEALSGLIDEAMVHKNGVPSRTLGSVQQESADE